MCGQVLAIFVLTFFAMFGKNSEAIEAYEKTIELNKYNFKALYNLAFLNEKIGENIGEKIGGKNSLPSPLRTPAYHKSWWSAHCSRGRPRAWRGPYSVGA